MQQVLIKITVPDDLPSLLVDALTGQRILETLLDNAIKHSPPQETISISVVQQDTWLQVCLTDRGSGIAPEHRALIFEPFAQLSNNSLEDIKRSVGLGLTFCKMAVEMRGGKIWIDSPEFESKNL